MIDSYPKAHSTLGKVLLLRQESFIPDRKHHENARRTEEDVQEVVLDDAEARRVDLDGLVPFTRYSVSVQVVNPEGVGPTATCTVSTDEGGGFSICTGESVLLRTAENCSFLLPSLIMLTILPYMLCLGRLVGLKL